MTEQIKKPYVTPKCEEVKFEIESQLLAGSDYNPYWEDNQPSEEDWWGK